jgi:CBS domain-containing protein
MTKLDTPPKVSDLMNPHVKTLTADATLESVVQFLLKHELSNAPVVSYQADGKPKLVGFISERDCLASLTQESFYGSPAPLETAGTIMRGSPICVTPENDLFTIASIFINHPYRHLPVTEDGILLGIISRRDVLKGIAEYYQSYGAAKLKERFRPDTHLIMYHRFINR